LDVVGHIERLRGKRDEEGKGVGYWDISCWRRQSQNGIEGVGEDVG